MLRRGVCFNLRPSINGVKVPSDKSTHELIAMLDHELPLFYVACKLLDAFGTETEKGDAGVFLQDEDGHVRKYADKMMRGNTAV